MKSSKPAVDYGIINSVNSLQIDMSSPGMSIRKPRLLLHGT